MIGLDANILIRYLANDDPVQSPQARDLIMRRLSSDEQGFVSLVALAETVWVLRRAHRYGRIDLADAIEHLVQSEVLVVDREEEVFAAMAMLRAGLGEFADALIGLLNQSAGCAHTLTFDRRAARLPGFQRA